MVFCLVITMTSASLITRVSRSIHRRGARHLLMLGTRHCAVFASALLERYCWLPGGALMGKGDLRVQLIDLLQGKALGLVDEKPYEGYADEAASKPDKENLGLQI